MKPLPSHFCYVSETIEAQQDGQSTTTSMTSKKWWIQRRRWDDEGPCTQRKTKVRRVQLLFFHKTRAAITDSDDTFLELSWWAPRRWKIAHTSRKEVEISPKQVGTWRFRKSTDTDNWNISKSRLLITFAQIPNLMLLFDWLCLR